MKPLSFNWKRRGASLSPGLIVLAALGSVGLDLQAQNVPEIVWLTNAQNFIYAVDFSADSRFLASAADDTTVKVWSATNGTLVRSFSVGGAAALSVALSPDGSYLVAGDGDGGTRLWRVADGFRLCGAPANGELIWSVAISRDGALLAIGKSDTSIDLANASCAPGGLLLEDHTSDVYSVVFSPDGSKLASASGDGTAKIWRTSDGAVLHTLTGHSNAVHSVDFSPDGALLATASADGTAGIWRVADGSVVRMIAGGGGGVAKFSADGQLLLSVNGGPINLWRVSNGKWLHTYTNANAGPLDVVSGGQYFAYGRSDGAVVLARLPLWISEASYGDYAVKLRWQGGSGRYQVQARMTLATGAWQNVGGPTTNTTFSSICLSPMFYRVQSLPAP